MFCFKLKGEALHCCKTWKSQIHYLPVIRVLVFSIFLSTHRAQWSYLLGKKKCSYPWFSINFALSDSIIHTYFGDSDYSGLYYIKHLGEVAQCKVVSQEGKWLLIAEKYLLRAIKVARFTSQYTKHSNHQQDCFLLLGRNHNCDYLVKTPQSLITNMVNLVEQQKKPLFFTCHGHWMSIWAKLSPQGTFLASPKENSLSYSRSDMPINEAWWIHSY